jgi:serine phosphatase RsbU (regulator of sigma subunit)
MPTSTGPDISSRLLRDLRRTDARAELRERRPSTRPAAASRRDALHDAQRRRTPARDRQDCRTIDVKVKLHTGDIVVFYTDGITEAQNESGEMWRRTPRQRGRGKSCRGTRGRVARVLEELETYTGEDTEDDVTTS